MTHKKGTGVIFTAECAAPSDGLTKNFSIDPPPRGSSLSEKTPNRNIQITIQDLGLIPLDYSTGWH
jgi:hypothetical protein